MLGWLFHRKKGLDDSQKSIAYGVLASDAQRPVTEQEWREQLGINVEMIRAYDLLDILRQLRVMASESKQIDFDVLALEALLSQIIRTSRLDKIDVAILTLKAQRIIGRIEMNMPEEFYEAGGINFLESCELIITTAISDAEGGWKAKLMKVTPKTFEIRMGQTEKAPREWTQ